MPIYSLIPFSLFCICCGLQFWFLWRVRDRLIRQHPRAFPTIEKSSMLFPARAIFYFTVNDAYRKLDDAKLNSRVLQLRILVLVANVAWLACAIAVFAMSRG